MNQNRFGQNFPLARQQRKLRSLQYKFAQLKRTKQQMIRLLNDELWRTILLMKKIEQNLNNRIFVINQETGAETPNFE